MNLYHYCNNKSFVEILRTREVWASDLSLSNDRLEGRWLSETFARSCREARFRGADLERTLNSLDLLNEMFGAGGFCLSEEGDLLSQWRGYADNGQGVNIGFADDYLKLLQDVKNREFGVNLKKVIYDVGEQTKLLAPFIDEIAREIENGALRSPEGTILCPTSDQEKKEIGESFRRMSMTVLTLFQHLYTLKNPAFREEKEWRLISYTLQKGNVYFDHELPSLEFVPRSDRVVPFRRIQLTELGPHPIRRVVLGPRNLTPVKVISAALTKYRFTDVEVSKSEASYR